VGTSKITWKQGSHNKLIGCGASRAYILMTKKKNSAQRVKMNYLEEINGFLSIASHIYVLMV
jgi:hypothetical protein